jgi:hypothetical protein
MPASTQQPTPARGAYGYAFKNSVDSAKSTVSDASDPVVMAANKEIIVQGDACTDEQCDVVQIYRTAQGGSTLVLLDEIPNPTSGKWTYEDTSADSNLNETSPAPLLNTPPPTGLIALEYHFSRIWGAVGNTVYYANAGNNQAFARTQSFVYPAKVTRLWSTTIGLLVFTVSDVYLIRGKGTDTDAFWSAGRFIKEIGLSNWDAFTVVGSTAYMMTNSRKVISLDPGAGVTEVGFPIGDQFALLYDPATTTLTWHEGQSGIQRSTLGTTHSDGSGCHLSPHRKAVLCGRHARPSPKVATHSSRSRLRLVTAAYCSSRCSATSEARSCSVTSR